MLAVVVQVTWLGILAGPETAAAAVGDITGFPLPAAGGWPAAIAKGPDGNLWFTEAGAARIGRITPAGTVTVFPVESFETYSDAITAGPDGNLWFTRQFGNQIGRITPTGVATMFAGPPSGSAFGVGAGPDGNVWFTGNLRGGEAALSVRQSEYAVSPGAQLGCRGGIPRFRLPADTVIRPV